MMWLEKKEAPPHTRLVVYQLLSLILQPLNTYP